MSLTALHAHLRPLAAAALALAALLGLCGGSCHVSYSSDHDCDDPDREHRTCLDATHGGASDPGPIVLERYELVAGSAPLVHPVRGLTHVRGARLGRRDAAALARFGERLVAGQPTLLALHPGAGRWVLEGARDDGAGGLEALWRQHAALSPGEPARALPGTWLVLRFDGTGALREVARRSYLSPALGVALLGAAAPAAPRAWETR